MSAFIAIPASLNQDLVLTKDYPTVIQLFLYNQNQPLSTLERC